MVPRRGSVDILSLPVGSSFRRGSVMSIHDDIDHGATDTEQIVSGALFDFLGFLTSLEEPVTMSARDDAGRAADLLGEWCAKRNLNIFDADVYNWQRRTSSELVRVARILTGKEKTEAEKEADQKRRTKKVDAIRTLAENITRLRHNVTRDLGSDNDKVKMTALAVALMDKTAERVGNEESASNGHVGVTGFKKKHLSVDGNKVSLKYIGKSGVQHDKSFSDKRIADIIRDRLERCSPNDFLLQCGEGYKVRADRVNRYLADFGVTAKDIRGYSANRLMTDALRGKKVPEDEKERKKIFLETLRTVAEDVGHGPQMLRKSYLLPTLEPAWINDGKIVSLSEA